MIEQTFFVCDILLIVVLCQNFVLKFPSIDTVSKGAQFFSCYQKLHLHLS